MPERHHLAAGRADLHSCVLYDCQLASFFVEFRSSCRVLLVADIAGCLSFRHIGLCTILIIIRSIFFPVSASVCAAIPAISCTDSIAASDNSLLASIVTAPTGTVVTLACPPRCVASGEAAEARVYGCGNFYGARSSVCLAAVHAGTCPGRRFEFFICPQTVHDNIHLYFSSIDMLRLTMFSGRVCYLHILLISIFVIL